IDPYSRSGHDSFEIYESMFSFSFARNLEPPAVSGNKFIGRLVKAVPGEALVGMRNDNSLKLRIVKLACLESCGDIASVPPVPVHGQHQPAALSCIPGRKRCCQRVIIDSSSSH